jgi:hypothetical protein
MFAWFKNYRLLLTIIVTLRFQKTNNWYGVTRPAEQKK